MESTRYGNGLTRWWTGAGVRIENRQFRGGLYSLIILRLFGGLVGVSGMEQAGEFLEQMSVGI